MGTTQRKIISISMNQVHKATESFKVNDNFFNIISIDNVKTHLIILGTSSMIQNADLLILTTLIMTKMDPANHMSYSII